jgi:hypothetical protein
MILYKHQLVELQSRNEPAIFLGVAENKFWFASYDYAKSKFHIDWHYPDTTMGYYKQDTKLPVYRGKKIYFGSMKENEINPPFNREDYPEERLKELQAYIDAFRLKLNQQTQDA